MRKRISTGTTQRGKHPTYLAIFGNFPLGCFNWLQGYLDARGFDRVTAEVEGGSLSPALFKRFFSDHYYGDMGLKQILENYRNSLGMDDEDFFPTMMRAKVSSLPKVLRRVIPEIKSRWPDLQTAVYSPWPKQA